MSDNGKSSRRSSQAPEEPQQDDNTQSGQDHLELMPVEKEQEIEQSLTSPTGGENANDAAPDHPIDPFDWYGLLQDYDKKIAALNDHEAEIYADFDKLVNYFGVWAETVQTHEVDRSWNRITTRQAHVSHSEKELESKREHYVKVVQAFQSALQLLNNT